METQSNVERRLEKVERAIIEIQNKIIDTDSIMTEEDFEALISYRKEKDSGRLVSQEEVIKELGLNA